MRQITLLTAVVMMLTMASCSEDFIDLAPPSNANAKNFYKTSADFNNAVISCYSTLQSGSQYSSNFFVLMEYRADNLQSESTSNADRYTIDNFADVPTNLIVNDSWASLYSGIYRCNEILDRIEAVDFDETLKNQYRGEARFIRALSYFNLVRLWGKVPLVTTPVSISESLKMGRVEESLVYATIEADLEFASANLPKVYDAANTGRVTNGGAKTLLGKVYLTGKKWAEASNVLKDVITTSPYKLLPKIADVFTVANEINDEIIFSIRFMKGGTGEGHGAWFSSTDGTTHRTTGIYNAYAATDTRKALLDMVKVGANYYVRKYQDTPSSSQDTSNDFPVLRFSDVLLMYAEALNEQAYSAGGDAFLYLNQVRTRAGATIFSAANLSGQAAFRDAVLNERRLEFPIENQRWFDLVRTGEAETVMTAAGFKVDSFREVYPVPQSEIQRVNDPSLMYQNGGY